MNFEIFVIQLLTHNTGQKLFFFNLGTGIVTLSYNYELSKYLRHYFLNLMYLKEQVLSSEDHFLVRKTYNSVKILQF